jgi:hypothetical protein
MTLGVTDFYSPVAKGSAAGFFVAEMQIWTDWRDKQSKIAKDRRTHSEKGNGVALLQNDPAKFDRNGEFSEKPILKRSNGRAQPPPFFVYWV